MTTAPQNAGTKLLCAGPWEGHSAYPPVLQIGKDQGNPDSSGPFWV